MFDTNFVEVNKVFWERFKEPETDNLLLVETADHPVINRSNAVTAKMVAKAKNLRIAWIKYNFTNEQLMKSYSENSIFLGFRRFSVFFRIRLMLISIYYYLGYVLFMDRVHSFKYKEVPYGDFIYDGYLAVYSMATLHHFDVRIAMVFYIVLLRDEQARELLGKYNIKAVLVAHYMGMITGILSRVAMQREVPVYWKGGGHEIFSLSVFKNLGQIYDYPIKPSMEEINLLAAEYKEIIEEDFKKIMEQADRDYYGPFTVAYNNTLDSDITKAGFLKDMGLKNKPIIFIMLHAFNDYPRSHFKSMLFKDYYDWFIETYRFALKDKTKNWIFKEHPANELYPTKDIDLDKVFAKFPEHVRFISHKSKITASAVLNVADLIVTCLGTAGVEMPALRGIPSIIAGDTFFSGFGFAIEPGSIEAYFEALKNFSPKILTPEQRLRAKCCYLYIQKYTSLPFAAGPEFTYEESKRQDCLKTIYPGRILESYRKNADLIYKQFTSYTEEIKKPNFKRLVSIAIGSKTDRNQEAVNDRIMPIISS